MRAQEKAYSPTTNGPLRLVSGPNLLPMLA